MLKIFFEKMLQKNLTFSIGDFCRKFIDVTQRLWYYETVN